VRVFPVAAARVAAAEAEAAGPALALAQGTLEASVAKAGAVLGVARAAVLAHRTLVGAVSAVRLRVARHLAAHTLPSYNITESK
jgi:hypothetical protein